MSEVFPSRIPELGIAVGTATQWLFNFVFSQVTPHSLDNIGWRTFLMFCIFNWALVVYVYFFIREVRLLLREDGRVIMLTEYRRKESPWKRWKMVSQGTQHMK